MQLLAAGGHGAPPPVLPKGLQIGNLAITRLLAGAVQRDIAPKPHGSQGPRKKNAGAASSYNSYVDLLNAFQELAAAAVNSYGAGLEGVKLGKDLSPDHREIIRQVRAVLLQGRSKDKAERVVAAQSWPRLSGKLQKAIGEAGKLRFPGEALDAATDAIAQVNARYFVIRPRATEPEPENFESFQDAVKGINELLFAFERMGEAVDTIVREEVPKRKDIAVSQAVIEINRKQRDRLEGVRLGNRLTRQHLKALETLRAILITARTESAGSAYRAWARWQRHEGTLNRILDRTLTFADADVSPVREAISRARETLATHYRAVHTQNIRAMLTTEHKEDEEQADSFTAAVIGKEAVAENRAIRDFRDALRTIEQNLGPSPQRPDEWVLMRDGQSMRLRADQGMAIRDAARTQVKDYMASLVTQMVEAWLTYDSIKRGTGSRRRKVLGFIGGADDPGDQEAAKEDIIRFRDNVVYALADQGKYVAALEAILSRKSDVERRARAVGDYDTDLDRGYKRLAIGASVVQVALVSLVPVAGQLAMAPTVVGGVVVAEGASALAVGGTAITTGAGASALAETGRQLAFEDQMDYGKIARTGRTGGLIGFGAVAPTVTKELAGFIAPGATGSTAVGANMAASALVGGVQSKVGGGSFIEGAAGGGLGAMTGSIVNSVAPVANAPITNMMLSGAAGGGVAYATGQDVTSGVVGGMAGSLGDRKLSKLPQPGGGGAPPPGSGGPGPGGPGPGDTLPGFGFDGRGPARTPGPGETLPGFGFDGRGAASPGPGAGKTLHGTGIDPKLPATPRRDTLHGTGIDPTLPAVMQGPGVDPHGGTSPGFPAQAPAPQPTVATPDALGTTMSGAPRGGTSPGMGVAAAEQGGPGGTIPGMGVAPDGPAASGSAPKALPKRSEFAALDDLAGRKPLFGEVVHVIESADDAAALYRRLHAEDRRPAKGTEDADIEGQAWKDDGGNGDPPMAWVRARDGAVRFNFSKFPRPNMGGYSDAPLGPIDVPLGAGQGGQPGPKGPAGPSPGSPTPKPAVFPGSNHPLQPGMRAAHVATEAEVQWQADNNPSKVYQSKTKDQHEQWYRMDHGEGDVPDAFWSGGTIVVRPGHPLGSVGDKNNPAARAWTMPESAYEAKPKKLTTEELALVAVEELRVQEALEQRLSVIGKGPLSEFQFENTMRELRAEPGRGTNQAVLDHAQVAWDAVHDPALIAEVLAKAYGAALRDGSSPQGRSLLNRALLREAAKGGPIHVVPRGSDIDVDPFFQFWVQTGRRFLDLGIDTGRHGNITHLIQDLVVDAAFKRRGMTMTSAQFRQALGGAEVRGMSKPGEPGNILWVAIYDATDGGLNQPEVLMPALRDVTEMESLE